MQFERSLRTGPVQVFASLLPAALLLLPLAGSAQPTPPPPGGTQVAQADSGPLGIEEIVVTARKREETLQTIPVAITAFGGEDLEAQQIENVSDLQLSIPNINYRKDNFSGAGTFRIRGIGNAAVAASADASTGIHVNTVPMQGARIFETEFYDVERIEVLRGPQSTLYGRNSSAGIINIITRKPDGELGGYVTAEGSNYTGGRLEGAVTIPFGLLGRWAEGHGVRIAAYGRSRDGFMKNQFTNNYVDDRELYGGRITFAGEIREDTDYSLMVSWFEEDDNRSRISNQGCTRDTTEDFPGDTNSFPFTIGCSPTASLGRDAPDYSATLSHQLVRLATLGTVPVAQPDILAGLLAAGVPQMQAEAQAAQMALQAFGFYNLFNPAGTDVFAGFQRADSLRQVSAYFDPQYEAQEFLATFEFNHRFGDYQVSVVGGYRSSESSDTTDYFWAVPTQTFRGPRIVGALPTDQDCPAGQRYYQFPDSDLLPGGSKAGCYDRDVLFDWAQARSQAATGELRLTSDFDGPFNYTAGASYFSLQNRTRYGVWGASLEEFWRTQTIPNLADTTFMMPPVNILSVFPGPSHFLNATQPYNLRALGFFGEGYLDLSENLQLTVGLRHINDRKSNRTRQAFLGVPPAWDFQKASWRKWIGKVGLDWQVTDDVLLYANAATGFKGGGFNPGQAAETGVTLAQTFEPEEIVSYEAGMKSSWLGGRLTANVSAFYYDYKDYQISQIQNRTALNQNVDAEVLGAELEVVWNVIENLLVNLSASYLDTEVKDFSSFDPANPAGGIPGAVNIKSPGTGGGNAVVPPGVTPQDCLRFFYSPLTAQGQAVVDGTCSAIPQAVQDDPRVNTQRDADGNIVPIYSALWGGALNPLAATALIGGYNNMLDGNALPNAPEITLRLGVAYTYPDLYGVQLTARADAYWQDSMFARIHNNKRDEIDSWEQVNASLELRYLRNPMLENISVVLWAQNLTDSDSITGHYLTDETSANFTNYFLLDPRTYGITIRYAFGGDY